MDRLPDFLLPQPDGWTAEFESWDMRNLDAYYLLSLPGRAPFMVSVFSEGGHDEASRAHLRSQLAACAAQGRSNTAYTGSFIWRLNRQKAGLFVPPEPGPSKS